MALAAQSEQTQQGETPPTNHTIHIPPWSVYGNHNLDGIATLVLEQTLSGTFIPNASRSVVENFYRVHALCVEALTVIGNETDPPTEEDIDRMKAQFAALLGEPRR